jgi:hypothetical protein
MPFEEGQSGNPKGRPKSAKLFKDALTLAIKRTDGDKTELALIAQALVDKAKAGDVPAINAIADRLDGKATQPISGDEDAAPILFARIERVIIDPSSQA